MMNLSGTYFCGNKASDYAIENGRLDYATLAKAFDAVLNNNIMEVTCDIGYWEQESGFIDNSEEIEELENEKEKLEERFEAGEFDETSEEYARITDIESEIEELEDEQTTGEIYQYYIVSDEGARILKDWANEIVFYNEALDMYVWGVTHYGTSWSYVLTGIKLNCNEE